MKTVKTYKNLSGKELLNMARYDGGAVTIDGESTLILPMEITFANKAEISSKDSADCVLVETRWMPQSILVIV
jgi:hypothetical protein